MVDNEYELLFIAVPPPRSGSIVEFLTDLDDVIEAAAVYTDTDVVALVKRDTSSGMSTVEKLETLGSPIRSIERCHIDGVVKGPSFSRGRAQGHSSFFAFVRCAINTEVTNFEFALRRLSRMQSIRFAYPSRSQNEIVLQVLSKDKITFDTNIMSDIQDAGGMVKSTRTYITINEMHWSERGIPVGRAEYSSRKPLNPVFMSLMSRDLAFGKSLAEQVYRDTQVKLWHYGLIQPGAESWSREVDAAIAAASGYLLLVTEGFLASPECQREFGRIESVAKPEQICCLVLPPVKFESLPQRYQARQCIDGRQFFAFSKLVQWIDDTV